jgi:hypothetical protein
MMVTEEVMAYYDTDGDMTVNPEDDIEMGHYNVMVEYCDTDFDGNIDACEMWACIIMVENEYRNEYCPNYGDIYCGNCPYVIQECEGEWNCVDIIYITDEVMAYYDTNNDGSINLGDNIETDHLNILIEYCDTDNSLTVDACEVHDCIVACEN